MKTNTRTHRMVLTAVLIALATVLSLIKIYKLPLGGSITLFSMLPISMLSIIYGYRWGFISAFLYSVLQFALDFGEVMSWGLTPMILIGTIVFDYLLAYTALGFSGVWANKGIKGIIFGISLSMVIRFISHFISGTILFASWCPEGWNVAWYSVCYNGSYMLPELIFTALGASALFKTPYIQKQIKEH